MKKPKIFGILNYTPDSFSDGGEHFSIEKAAQKIAHIAECGVEVLDIGAESTRPGAKAISSEEEIARLKNIIPEARKILDKSKTLLSLDSRNFQTIKYFEDYIDIVNDVSGLYDRRIVDLVRYSRKKAVFMHSLVVPAQKEIHLDNDVDIISHMQTWFEAKLNYLDQNGIYVSQLIFDPGIGFGITPRQSLDIIKNHDQLVLYGVEILLGYSRKSFLMQFGATHPKDRDSETHAITTFLALKKFTNYIRVHDYYNTCRIIKLVNELGD